MIMIFSLIISVHFKNSVIWIGGMHPCHSALPSNFEFCCLRWVPTSNLIGSRSEMGHYEAKRLWNIKIGKIKEIAWKERIDDEA